MKCYQCDIDKLLDALIDVSNSGVSLEAIIRSIIKNYAHLKCEVSELREELDELRNEYLSDKEEEDDDE